MNERPRWRLLNDDESPPAGRYAQDLGDGRRAWFDDLDDETDECPAITVTFFADHAATTKREECLTLTALAELIRATNADTKQSLPWLKLAKFGDARTDKNSLRHNSNILVIGGIEGDADNGQVSFEAAVQLLRAAGISALVYTSPGHAEDAPRWRALCPLSQEHPPGQRDRFMARLNGALQGVLANESWTLSQSYYYGSVNRNPSHQVVVIEGTCVDLADRLDATAIGKPEKPRANGDARHRPRYTPRRTSLTPVSAVSSISCSTTSAMPAKAPSTTRYGTTPSRSAATCI